MGLPLWSKLLRSSSVITKTKCSSGEQNSPGGNCIAKDANVTSNHYLYSHYSRRFYMTASSVKNIVRLRACANRL
eukprot:1179869-Prorocentrum_minimum.AAC.5